MSVNNELGEVRHNNRDRKERERDTHTGQAAKTLEETKDIITK